MGAKDQGLVVGPARMARMYKRSVSWAERLLLDWAREQADGGPVRVFVADSGAFNTTIAVLHKELPCAAAVDTHIQGRIVAAEASMVDMHRKLDLLHVETLERRAVAL